MSFDNEAEGNDFDLTQEIARSGFADMLHDTDRNRRYKRALQSVIQEKHDKGEAVHVVDIGTGTGLLSLMAAEAGADRVTAVEAFTPAANVARTIFERSRYRKKIDLISSRSTDLRKGSVTEKGNVIVAEVFDTELNGEGALRTFKEALETLVEPGCRVIPASAKVFVMPVQSDLLQRFNKLPSVLHQLPSCDGTAAVFDVQLSAVDRKDIVAACAPFVAFSFDFETADSIVYDETVVREATVQHHETLTVDTILLWWELDMDGSGKNIISTAPSWIDSNYQWRDHWMQAVYFLPQTLTLGPGEHFYLRCSHDEFSFWFNADNSIPPRIERPICTCMLHCLCPRSAFYRMNSVENDHRYLDLVGKACANRSVLCISEGSLIGLYAAKTARQVTIVEPEPSFRIAIEMKRRLGSSHLQNVEVCETSVSIQPDAVLSEPFFLTAILPWDNFTELCQRLRALSSQSVVDISTVELTPSTMILYAMPVAFEHLWKIVAPVGTVEGFDLSPFDDVCQKAHEKADRNVEPQPLWEYRSIATGSAVACERLELRQCIANNTPRKMAATLEVSRAGTNGIALWVDWESTLPDGTSHLSSTGLTKVCDIGQEPVWHKGYRQGVHFVPLRDIPPGSVISLQTTVDCDCCFGDFEFSYGH